MPQRRNAPNAWTIPAILLVAAFPLVGCGGGPSANGAHDAATGESDGENRAPDFAIPDLNGEEFRLADAAGQVVLLDFWATWCAPCRDELPMLARLDQEFGDQGFAVVGISDEDADVIREFVEENGITYTNLVDPGNVSQDYTVLGLPTAFLLDREGRIVERFVGPKPPTVLERKIRELL